MLFDERTDWFPSWFPVRLNWLIQADKLNKIWSSVYFCLCGSNSHEFWLVELFLRDVKTRWITYRHMYTFQILHYLFIVGR